MLDERLHLAPIIANPQNMLDIATGSGIWAIEFADLHPYASVIANDLSPVLPEMIPPNLAFEVDDTNEAWTYHRKFDLIHCRQHHCAIAEPRLFEQSFQFLKPGGRLEMQELGCPIRSDNSSLSLGSALHQWSTHLMDATKRINQGSTKPSATFPGCAKRVSSTSRCAQCSQQTKRTKSEPRFGMICEEA